MKVARSKKGMVVAAHPLAAQAGRDILAAGGNAVEAAVAVSLALNVVEPQASGLGGGGLMLISPQGDPDKTITIDGRGCYSSLFAEEYIYPKGTTLYWTPIIGRMSATVPGLGRMLEKALHLFGESMSLSRLAESAIHHAEEGFPVNEVMIYCSSMYEWTLRNSPEAAKVFYNNGRRFKPGELLVQKDLANTLRLVAEKGFEVCYTGELGQELLATMNETGPLWGEDDLKNYEAKVREPLWGEIEGYRIATMGPPSRGGAGMLKALKVLENAPEDPAERIVFLLQVFEKLFKVLDPIITDPDTKEIDLDFDLDTAELGPAPRRAGGTSHICVIDSNNTVVTMASTLQHFFGSGIMLKGRGLLINNDISDVDRFPGRANSIGANKRSVANMAPTVAFKDGPRFILGTPGGPRIFPAMACVISRLLYDKMELEEAILAGRMHWEKEKGFVEGDIPEDIRARVKELYPGTLVERAKQDLFFGGMSAIQVLDDGTKVGVADPRRAGAPAGL